MAWLPPALTVSGVTNSDSDLGADRSDIQAVAAALDRMQSGLIVLVSDDSGLAFAVAQSTAEGDIPAEQRAFDLHLARPEGASWTVSELEDFVLRPSRNRPYSRAHVVVADADQMAPALADRLLKVVEEPSADVIFWFCVKDLTALPTTLVGRAGAVIHVSPTPASERLAALMAVGAGDEDAQAIASLCGTDMRLALAAARHQHLEHLRTMLATPLSGERPTALADAVVAAVMVLANDLSKDPTKRPAKARAARPSPAGRPRWSDLKTPAARAEGRRLVRKVLDMHAAQLRRAAVHADTYAQLAHTHRCISAVAAARNELATNSSPTTVLPALWNRCVLRT